MENSLNVEYLNCSHLAYTHNIKKKESIHTSIISERKKEGVKDINYSTVHDQKTLRFSKKNYTNINEKPWQYQVVSQI